MRKRFGKTIIAGALVTAFLLQASPTYAVPTSELNQRIEDANASIRMIDDKIIESMVKIEELHNNISESEEKIEKVKKDLKKAEEEYNLTLDVSMDRIRNMQRSESNRFLDYLNVLLSSDGLSDFIQRTKALSVIIDSDQKMLENLAEKDNQLREKEEELEKELVKLEEKKSEAEAEKAAIEREKDTVEEELQRAEELLEEQRREEEARQARLAQVAEASQTAQTNQVSRSSNNQTSSNSGQATSQDKTPAAPSSNKANALINEAKKHLGTPYVWGGSTPSGFDCSGFTQYVFNQVGVSIPRVSQAQQTYGTPVPLNQLQPGDLLFSGTPAYHVGIYIGNNQYIHAPQTGDVVKIVTINPNNFTNARRVL